MPGPSPWKAPSHSAARTEGTRRSRSLPRRHTVRMAYDEELAKRVRRVVQDEPGLSERRMFGGLAFLVNGNMAVSASSQGGLLLRVDPDQTESLADARHVRRFRMRDREMNGWLHVDAEVLETDDDLRRWVAHGLTYARSLVAK
jgi:TfoX/Sxy family transcriptional regulator of competence genes